MVDFIDVESHSSGCNVPFPTASPKKGAAGSQQSQKEGQCPGFPFSVADGSGSASRPDACPSSTCGVQHGYVASTQLPAAGAPRGSCVRPREETSFVWKFIGLDFLHLQWPHPLGQLPVSCVIDWQVCS